MTVLAVNSTVGPEGLAPILLVFGAVPSPDRSISEASQLLTRQQAIESAFKAAENE